MQTLTSAIVRKDILAVISRLAMTAFVALGLFAASTAEATSLGLVKLDKPAVDGSPNLLNYDPGVGDIGLLTIVNFDSFLGGHNQSAEDSNGNLYTGFGTFMLELQIQHSDAGVPRATPAVTGGSLKVASLEAPWHQLPDFTFWQSSAPDINNVSGWGGPFGFNASGMLEFVFLQEGDSPGFGVDGMPVGVIITSTDTVQGPIDFTQANFFALNSIDDHRVKHDTFALVPEPASLGLMAIGAATLMMRGRRRRAA